MKIGLYFGSFNPIHIGHLVIANTMAENTDLDKVWFVVSPQNPFKRNEDLLHEQDRYTLVETALYDNPKLGLTDIEFHLPKPSYTIDTLVRLEEKYPQHQFVLIMGQDNLEHFHKWKNHEVILERFPLYVYPRPGSEATRFDTHPQVHLVEAPLMDISATWLRKAIKAGRNIRYLVPEAVEGLIKLKGYYQ